MGHITEEAIRNFAAIITVQLTLTGKAHFVHDPGNLTIYDMWIVSMDNGRHLVAMPEWRACFHFRLKDFLHPVYVAEKLPGTTLGDAAVIAELLMAIGEAMP